MEEESFDNPDVQKDYQEWYEQVHLAEEFENENN